MGTTFIAVDAPDGPRFDAALAFLREGRAITYSGIDIMLQEPMTLDCAIRTQWRIENLNEQLALQEIRRGQTVVEDLISQSPAFAALARRRAKRFSLISDYGTGCVEVGRLDGNSFVRLTTTEDRPVS